MFVSLTFNGVYEWDEKDRGFFYHYSLVDTDFQSIVRSKSMVSHHQRGIGLIQVYKDRGLEVEVNLVLYMLFLEQSFGFRPKEISTYLYNYEPEYRPYMNGVEKYLELIP